jgi:hypothetical protein
MFKSVHIFRVFLYSHFHKMSEYGGVTDSEALPDIFPEIHFVFFY